MITFDEGLPQFLSRKQISVHPKTYNGYVSKTKVFSLWLKDHGLSQKPLGELTNDNIADFFVYIARDRDLDRPTCEKYCNNIKAVFQFFEESEGITKLPFRNVSYPIKKRDCAPKSLNSPIRILSLSNIGLWKTITRAYCGTFMRPLTFVNKYQGLPRLQKNS